MRIVLDTNVLVSALLRFGSVPQRALQMFFAGRCECLIDERIFAEYRAVLTRPFLAEVRSAADEILAFVRTRAEWVVAAPLDIELPDSTDLPFLEVALTGGADAIVTGNGRDFVTRSGRTFVPILTPRQLLERLALSLESRDEP